MSRKTLVALLLALAMGGCSDEGTEPEEEFSASIENLPPLVNPNVPPETPFQVKGRITSTKGSQAIPRWTLDGHVVSESELEPVITLTRSTAAGKHPLLFEAVYEGRVVANDLDTVRIEPDEYGGRINLCRPDDAWYVIHRVTVDCIVGTGSSNRSYPWQVGKKMLDNEPVGSASANLLNATTHVVSAEILFPTRDTVVLVEKTINVREGEVFSGEVLPIGWFDYGPADNLRVRLYGHTTDSVDVGIDRRWSITTTVPICDLPSDSFEIRIDAANPENRLYGAAGRRYACRTKGPLPELRAELYYLDLPILAGAYAGQAGRVDIVENYLRAVPGYDTLSYYWNPGRKEITTLPAGKTLRLALDHKSTDVAFLPGDSAFLWQIIRNLEWYYGDSTFVPSTMSEVGSVAEGTLVYVDTILAKYDAGSIGTFSSTNEVVGGLMVLRADWRQGHPFTIYHSLGHVLGLGHCGWPGEKSLMSGAQSASCSTPEWPGLLPNPRDVANLRNLRRAKRVEMEKSPLYTGESGVWFWGFVESSWGGLNSPPPR